MANAWTGDPVNFVLHAIRDNRRFSHQTKLHIEGFAKRLLTLVADDPRQRAVAAETIATYAEWAHVTYAAITSTTDTPDIQTRRVLGELLRKCLRVMGSDKRKGKHAKTSIFTAPPRPDPRLEPGDRATEARPLVGEPMAESQ